MMIRSCVRTTVASVLALLAAESTAGESIEFERDIQPILRAHCADCHGEGEQNGGISFAHRPSVFAEADSGERAVVAGDVGASNLLARISTDDQSLRMPPDGDRLTDEQIERLRDWVAAGAPWPEVREVAMDEKSEQAHWAFQPITDPVPPAVQDETWPRGALDRFIQSRRENAGLSPAPDTDPVTLIRRATYALTGLPPTPTEVQEFVAAADSPQGIEKAFADLVDRLLTRASYGERWGRHWMDWVRYADTAGDNSDFPIPQAYRYRNYIIDAFNEDLPYDRFLTEQLAGDLLPANTLEQRNRQTIATGYLAMARRFGSLVERYPWHLTIEDTIDNVGRTMMGLTISCARCHDHKFDSISTRDYYGMYGIFASTRYPFPGIELFQTQRDLVPLISDDEVAEVLEPYREETEKLSAELDRLLTACDKRAAEIAAAEGAASIGERRKMRDELDAMLLKARRAGTALANHLKEIPPIPTAYAVQDGKPHDARIQIKGEPVRPGAEVPRRFLDVLGGQRVPDEVAQSSSGRLQLARWIASAENPLTARVIVNRVWQRHFGEGIVPSTSDFGTRGQQPSNPQLLDWLATQFIESGWSVKQLHRLIMNSRTYRLSSQEVDENLASDPDNRLYWKFSRRRLDAEEIRDTLLMISGELDLTPQAKPYPIPPQSEWTYTQHHPFKDDYPNNKRSVYQMTKRLTVKPYLQTFDGADPNVCTSDRGQSVTPLQALYFVNDPFVHERADQLATMLLRELDDDQQRVEQLFAMLLAREPAPDETSLMLEHVEAVRERRGEGSRAVQQAWSSLVRSIVRLNEFIYID